MRDDLQFNQALRQSNPSPPDTAMNWLAHVLLSEPTPAFRIGNLLPDLLRATELAGLPQSFAAGIARHRVIDQFTDRHPVVRQSIGRIAGGYRRFAPILVDVFYDHFLSVGWQQYCSQPLDLYLEEFYDSFASQQSQLPEEVLGHLQRMRAENWLGSYRDAAGVQLTLARISRRFRRPVELGGAVGELDRHYAGLRADFTEFFPELRAHVGAAGANPDNSPAASTYL